MLDGKVAVSNTDKSRNHRSPGRGHVGHGYVTRGGFQSWRRMRTREGRRVAKTALRSGQEPEPYRPRHGALWDWT